MGAVEINMQRITVLKISSNPFGCVRVGVSSGGEIEIAIHHANIEVNDDAVNIRRCNC